MNVPIRRWQPAISTAATLTLLITVVAEYAASREVLPPGGGGDERIQLAAVGTPLVNASSSPTTFSCDADVRDVTEVDRIRAAPPTGSVHEYTPVGRADEETVAAVRTVYERFNACSAPHGIFSSHEFATDRYVRSTGTGEQSGYDIAYAMNRVIHELILDNGRVREEFTAAAWWSMPASAPGTARSFQPENVFVLSDGRVAGLSGDLTIPHEYRSSDTPLPAGIYWFVAFAQEDSQWLVDEQFGVGIGQRM